MVRHQAAVVSGAGHRLDSPFATRVFNSILPSLTLTLVVTAHMMRMTRASIINLMALPYIEMARPGRVASRGAAPRCPTVAPIVNVVALNLPSHHWGGHC